MLRTSKSRSEDLSAQKGINEHLDKILQPKSDETEPVDNLDIDFV